MRRLEIMAIIVMALVVLGTPAGVFGYEAFLRSQTPNEFTLAGNEGAWSPKTIRVKQGQKVKLRLTSNDVAHGFTVPDLDIDVAEIYPGKWVEVQFVAEKAGTYPFFCTVLCNPLHGSMRGEIVVEETSSASGTASAKPSASPSTASTDAGRSVFQNKCAACHGLKGQGGMGPSLVGVDPSRVKRQVRTPEGGMPPFPTSVLGEDDLQKLVDYIGTLTGK